MNLDGLGWPGEWDPQIPESGWRIFFHDSVLNSICKSWFFGLRQGWTITGEAKSWFYLSKSMILDDVGMKMLISLK